MNSKIASSRVLKIALLSATVIAGLPAVSQAQEAKSPAAGDTLEAVVVTGFKQSYANAVRAKKNAIEITDGISSDGLGRFPDLNVGEALQRVPGVQINREAEGRDATINLRGMPGEYARMTLNGQAFAEPPLLRDNQGSPLGAFNSDIFSAFVIQKSPMANAQTGGLSGNVDLQIAPALSRREGGSMKAAYEYNTLGDLGAPAVTVSYNKVFSSSLAAFGTLAYRKENFRRDSILINNYAVLTPAYTGLSAANFVAKYGEYYSSTPCTTGSSAFCSYVAGATGTKGTSGLYFNSQTRQYARMNKGETWSASGGLEWKPNDQTKMGLIGYYTDRDLPKTRQDLMINGLNAGSIITPVGTPFKVSDGRYVYDQISFTNPDALMSSRLNSQHQASRGVMANIDWSNENWRLAGVLTASGGKNSSVETQVDANTLITAGGNGISGTLSTGRDDIGDYSYTITPSPVTGIPAGTSWSWLGASDPTSLYNSPTRAAATRRLQLTGTQSYAENSLYTAQFDAERFVELGPIKSIQGGARLERASYTSAGYRVYAFGLQTQNITSAMVKQAPYVDDFFGGKGGAYTKNWQVIDLDAFLDAVRPVTEYTASGGGLSPTGFNIRYQDDNYALRNYTSDDDNTQAYVMAKYDTELAGHRVRGNVGVRYENTDNTLEALDQKTPPADGIGTRNSFSWVTYKNKYDFFLPSAIFAADVTDDIVLRGAYYKTYVKPHPRQFSAITKIGSRTLDTTLTSAAVAVNYVPITIGNNKLKPYMATSMDLSLEWYNRPNGLISLAVFEKSITGRIVTTSDPAILCPSDGSTWGLGTLAWDGTYCTSSQSTSSNVLQVRATGSYNLDKATKVRGLEFNIQQNLDFLPGFWKDFGGSFNYAYTTSKSAAIAPFPGISKHNVNMIGYYETPKYGVRLVYNYRSAYDLNSNGTFTGGSRSVRPRGQLDLAASYNVSDRFSLGLDVYNLTDAIRFEYENDEDVVRTANYDGRTITLTARAAF
ncbi:TonB-dependent receptor [Caulobacter vibrioides]|uniref:TonB-dependent receptor n=1 Tax=Caulobacter vibrioides TaxID=155892 RepID=UPI000BB4F1F9|nr:TonB-dependent receptor [Caulobacter vibrioides]ATC23571.1 TonB-dependent receptor [Caulobacter vibrioides]AZH11795.1 TonB-dependent receptor [Caulobacter vibrioides]PLR11836.1 TonB-dependent receptor [Caulobacter vibrioides]